MELVISVKGIGKQLATALIVTTAGFTRYSNAKQLAKFIGICPTYYQAGRSVKGKSTISRRGVTLRSLLYMVALSAMKHNQACKELYDRLKAAGKASKVGAANTAEASISG